MSAPDWTLVTFDDWQVLWCNGEKVMENHTLSAKDVLETICGEEQVSFKSLEGYDHVNENGEADTDWCG